MKIYYGSYMKKTFEQATHFWFGNIEKTIAPTEKRAHIWFSSDKKIDHKIKKIFGDLHQKVATGKCDDYKSDAQSSLAMIIVLDQFSRHMYRGSKKIYDYDQQAVDLTKLGIEKELDHQLSLIERSFYYQPLMHSENINDQKLAIKVFDGLATLALPETRVIFNELLDYAVAHYKVIDLFGRFPHRNKLLKRKSTVDELAYLKAIGNYFKD